MYLDGKLEIYGEGNAVGNVETIFLGERNNKESSWEGRPDEAAIINRALRATEAKGLSNR